MKNRTLIIINIFVLLLCGSLSAQATDYNHPELRWKSVETPHFIFYYHTGTEKSTNRFINVAEEVYESITSLYNYRPKDKMRIVVNDYDDYANGGAYYFNNKISLWSTALETELRGSHNWFKNVFTHEFSHMIQLHLAKKATSYTPGVYLQWTGYEVEKRKDVLTGYPNVISSYNVPMHIIPAWFAEGVAQNQDLGKFNFDFWDALRDMNYRERVLSGNALSYAKLADFGNKTSHEAEAIYNTGMNFTRHIVKLYGKDILAKVSREMSSIWNFSFENALQKFTGVPTEKLYNDFVENEKSKYLTDLKKINANLVTGKDISDSGYYNSHPKISPDGRYVAYLSTLANGEATFYRRGLFMKDLKTDSVKMVYPAVGVSAFSWDLDSKALFYAKTQTNGIYGNQYSDIFMYDLDKKREDQLTVGKRASNPAISPDGNSTAMVINRDGNQNIYIMNNDKATMSPLTRKKDGTVYYQTAWNQDGSLLAVDFTGDGYGRNIEILNLEGKQVKIFDYQYDVRQPAFDSEGKFIYYSSDKTGIFNIYRQAINGGDEELITNVRGGAFYPHVKGDTLVFVEYTGIKMKLRMLVNPKPLNSELANYRSYQIPEVATVTSVDYLTNPKNYLPDFEHIFIIPRLAIDNKEFKPGIYFFLNDYLEKISLLGGVNINRKKDYELFGLTEFRFLLPTVYGLAINVVKHSENSFTNTDSISGFYKDSENKYQPVYKETKVDYTYDLKEINVGFKAPLTYIPKIGNYPLGRLVVDLYAAMANYKASADYGNVIINYNYYKNSSLNLKVDLSAPSYGLNGDINPTSGRSFAVQYSRHFSDFITGFEVDGNYGTLKEVYAKNEFNKFDLKWTEHFSLPHDPMSGKEESYYNKIGLSLGIRGSYLGKDSIDSFYNDYIGGLTGMKGYSFYSLGGTRTMIGSASLRFPIIDRVNWAYGSWSLKKIYLSLFANAGLAWNGQDVKGALTDYAKDNVKTDIGGSLRLYAISFYNFPTAMEYSVAYGLNQFAVKEAVYGKEFRHYFTLLFDFASLYQ